MLNSREIIMKYKTEALGVAYEIARDIYEVGGMTESEIREFERDCLVQEETTTPSAQSGPIQHNSIPRPHGAANKGTLPKRKRF